jgi:OmpA-OmpF porin, OOP family
MPIRPLLLALLIGAFASSHAAAQSDRDFSSVRYRPAVGPNNYLGLEGADARGHLRLSYGLAFDYSRNTLEVQSPCRGVANARTCEAGDTQFIQQTGLVHLLFGMSIKAHTQLSLDLPFGGTDSNLLSYMLNDSGPTSPYRSWRPADGFAFADARLLAKTRFYRSASDKVRLAAAGFSTLPSAMLTSHGDCGKSGQCTYLGDRGGVQVGAFAIAEFLPHPKLRFAINTGALYRPKRDLLGTGVSSEFSFGGGVAYAPIPLLSAKAEIVGALALAGSEHDLPLEARGGLSFGRDLVFTLGGGGGIVGDVGSPAYRVFGGVVWTPVRRDADRDGLEDDHDKCPTRAEDRDGFQDEDGCPDLDNDGDGIPDAKDRCIAVPEDRDGFQDEDGCPDNDNDGDGVRDGYDTCEGLKEDIDGDHDDDGCPDLDTDRDGIEDTHDTCPLQGEDTDGLGDEDGCPEADFDGDGIDDTADRCPEAPETRNGVADQDGCPEA